MNAMAVGRVVKAEFEDIILEQLRATPTWYGIQDNQPIILSSDDEDTDDRSSDSGMDYLNLYAGQDNPELILDMDCNVLNRSSRVL